MPILILLACIGLFMVFGVQFLYVLGLLFVACFVLMQIIQKIALWDLKRVARDRGMSEENIEKMVNSL